MYTYPGITLLLVLRPFAIAKTRSRNPADPSIFQRMPSDRDSHRRAPHTLSICFATANAILRHDTRYRGGARIAREVQTTGWPNKLDNAQILRTPTSTNDKECERTSDKKVSNL